MIMILALALAAAIQAGPVTPDNDAYLDTNGCMRWHSTPEDAPVCDTYQVDLTLTTDPIAACLYDQGWQGSDSDGQAVIYAPWVRIERCTGTEV